jgi:hypothetical protein
MRSTVELIKHILFAKPYTDMRKLYLQLIALQHVAHYSSVEISTAAWQSI